MSHTITFGGIIIHHNGDFSGTVRIEHPGRIRAGAAGAWVEVPIEALEILVAEKLRRELMAELEDASPRRLLRGGLR